LVPRRESIKEILALSFLFPMESVKAKCPFASVLFGIAKSKVGIKNKIVILKKMVFNIIGLLFFENNF